MENAVSLPVSDGFFAQIEAIRARREGAEIVLLLTISENGKSESFKLTIPTEVYCEKKLRRGVISKELFEELQTISRRFDAIRCGENLLAFGPNTEQRLTRKIMRHGFTRDEAEEATKILLERGLIREEEDMRAEVVNCLRKLWGRRRIEFFLRSKGYADKTISGLPELLRGVDFPKQCARLIRKYYGEVPTDRAERDRMYASLTRYGYSLDEIRHALQIL